MTRGTKEINIKGRLINVPALTVDDKVIVVRGRWLKLASVLGEDWQMGETVQAPELLIARLREHKELGADLFTFAQKVTDTVPHFGYPYEWDSVAAIPIISYSDWWKNRVPYRLRQDVKRAGKRGIVVRVVSYTDDFVHSIMGIYNETPIRQGRPFSHYKKTFEEVKRANATHMERSEFVGAYLEDELVGFVKIVYVGRYALFSPLAKESQRERRPMNALIAKTVELVAAKGCSHLIYGQYRYAQGADSLTAFKHRNGFEEILVPRYYVPLTLKGRLALRLHLHHGVKALVPNFVRLILMRVRLAAFNVSLRVTKTPTNTEKPLFSSLTQDERN